MHTYQSTLNTSSGLFCKDGLYNLLYDKNRPQLGIWVPKIYCSAYMPINVLRYHYCKRHQYPGPLAVPGLCQAREGQGGTLKKVDTLTSWALLSHQRTNDSKKAENLLCHL